MQPSDSAVPVGEGTDQRRHGGSPAGHPSVTPSPATAAVDLESATESGLRPPNEAEAAQARLFDELLCAEIARLEHIATSAADRWEGRGERGRKRHEPPEALAELRAAIDEAHVLLAALRQRFPAGLPAGDPPLSDRG